MNQRMNEWMNERTVNEKNEDINNWANELMTEMMNKWISKQLMKEERIDRAKKKPNEWKQVKSYDTLLWSIGS